ncbi:hypothetical protein XENOCAPTIV_028065 [Xenoophorus captivus]|uniref:Uncharacterized protein n=1 Tax=Xenoophorus captivus TaxID=1517983 RepID=A0ABV0QNH1_9TELE
MCGHRHIDQLIGEAKLVGVSPWAVFAMAVMWHVCVVAGAWWGPLVVGSYSGSGGAGTSLAWSGAGVVCLSPLQKEEDHLLGPGAGCPSGVLVPGPGNIKYVWGV